MAAAGPQCPRGVTSNVDYWLRSCEVFRVDAPQAESATSRWCGTHPAAIGRT